MSYHNTAAALMAALGLAGVSMHAAAQQPLAPPTHLDSTATNIGLRELGIGTAILAAMVLVDKPVARAFEGYHGPNTQRVADAFDKFGEFSGVGVVLGGLGVASLVTRSPRVTRTLVRTASSVAIASVAASAIKYAVGRARPYADPDGDGLDFTPLQGAPIGTPAFPSGHASVAFALATSLGDAIDNGWARAGLWGIATGTSWARLQLDQHWLSDVVAGAAVGILSARVANGRLRVLGIRAPEFVVGSHTAGMRWSIPMPRVR